MRMNETLMALGMASALFAGCGGGSSDPAPVSDPPPLPEAPQAITCEPSAANLTKTTLRVGAVDREYYDAAPSNYAALRERDARGITVVVNFHDEGQTGQSGAAATCWNELSEAKGIITVFPSAIGGSWNSKGASTGSDEVAFLKAMLPAIKSKYNIATNAMVYYTGVGQGARMAQAMAMQAPQFLGGVAGVGGTAEPEIFALPSAQRPATTMAAWIIKRTPGETEPTEAQQVAYWNEGNGVYTPATEQLEPNFSSQVYASPERAAQRVKVSTPTVTGYAGKALSEQIWDTMFAKTVRFLDDNRSNGSMRPNLTIEEMGMTDNSKEFIAGSPRRWLTYLPSNYAGLTAGGRTLPLVLSLHGRNGSGRWQALTSDWHSVAERNGFIVVYPQGTGATWTGSMAADNPDVQFLQSLIEELKTRHAVDPTRIYINGASMGSLMTQRMAVQHPLLFAAIAPCYSGYLSAANYANAIVRTDVPMPTWLCRGQDELPTDFPGGTAGEAAGQVFWRETVNRNTGLPTLQLDGRRVSQIWNNGLAEFRWQVTEYQPHFWNEGQSQKIWDEMFSKYQRSGSGQLVRLP
jgi:poly(3-hydroxybutyrate) depolymerase